MKTAEIVTEQKLQTMFEDTKQNNEVLIIDFFATWCGPCQMYIPIFDKVNSENEDKNIKFIKTDIDTLSEKTITQFDVHSVPTTLIVKNGEVVSRTLGFQSQDQLVGLVNKNK